MRLLFHGNTAFQSLTGKYAEIRQFSQTREQTKDLRELL